MKPKSTEKLEQMETMAAAMGTAMLIIPAVMDARTGERHRDVLAVNYTAQDGYSYTMHWDGAGPLRIARELAHLLVRKSLSGQNGRRYENPCEATNKGYRGPEN